MSTADVILNYAEVHNRFTLEELSDYIRNRISISNAGILWHIRRLINDNRLSRIARGIYGHTYKKEYLPTLMAKHRKIYLDIHKAFPLIDICVYCGSDLSALQHHISSNNALYIEVTKEATEAVFHYLHDQGLKVYHRPNENFMTEYVNLSEECYIVKPLVTESPLVKVDGIPTPSIEKILVDINADDDFYYLQGDETFYIVQHAQNRYLINEPKMLRYASRRGIRQKMIDLLQYKEP